MIEHRQGTEGRGGGRGDQLLHEQRVRLTENVGRQTKKATKKKMKK